MSYRCKDGMCGATDCSNCYPGNDREIEEQEAHDEYMEDKLQQAMDERAAYDYDEQAQLRADRRWEG